ncbi:hypothetical protein Taro_011172 [Colocasia esculenta]|uniref:UspA domain-containing protein n=1 Tax=Colocasia esculenta TaxID=4460 RepID=A0A843U9U1_COLES|nr:hypothetical protein [Colocasia esculenta]
MAESPAAVAGGNLRCVVVAVDGSEESMNALRWALDNLHLDGHVQGAEEQQPGVLHVLHVQSPPSIAAGLNPGGIPFGGPSTDMVPALFSPSSSIFVPLVFFVFCFLPFDLSGDRIPSGHVEVPAFTAAIEAHQRRISEAIITHAIQICSEKHVNAKPQVVVGDSKELICEVTANLHADLLVMGCRAFGAIKRSAI